jgi:hypothetical protein
MKIKPCRKCGSSKIEIHDCGYSSFNAGHAKCLKCGHELKLSNFEGEAYIIRMWNKDKPTGDEAIRLLRKQLKEAGLKPCV